MSARNAYRGGRLEDMAPTGTTIPDDASVPRTISSVPRPDQDPNHRAYHGDGADNPEDIPRRNRDLGTTGEVVTGTGDRLPVQVESKRMHFDPNNPAAKGHDRAEKHRTDHHADDIGRYGGKGAEVDVPPGEEGLDQDTIRPPKTA
ncbi:hypothetical protein P152DRAFT_453524 [Eremomyces bilateralis CBS 781.70]|uniref:Uncharacterized protein n=1 Tax=Eremomyces bilateralis CBS 781.70 TaxID=1392243 RepID=A0A6G1GFW0_9PEZI|nr:uncharacterized protein P152DRAFT_453524 [Eremomyces bilateralis CBS 781.70]KAF1816914.1 hypothetical protein P152DRAFT_453524 [Eremomyces bilateralis CBS 781.70]